MELPANITPETKSPVIIAQEVLRAFSKCKAVVFVVGAGISTSCGIPNFRGASGIYKQKGGSAKDIFDTSVAFSSPASCSAFYKATGEMYQMAEAAKPSATHAFSCTSGKKW